MRTGLKAGVLVALIVVAIAAGGGYWFGTRQAGDHDAGKPDRKILYYRNPMGLPDTSPMPKKDPMGMDYIPVYEGEEEESAGGHQIRLSTEKVQKLGVRVEAATLQSLGRVIRAVGRIEPDERRIYAITPKFEGYVERLHVSVTGQFVARDQPLFEVYSPELLSAQREYAIAARAVDSLKDAPDEALRGMRELADASLARLRNWDISDEQLKSLATSGEIRRTLTFRSPVAGIVTGKQAVQGMRFMPGEALYQVIDLSSVWVIVDVFEQDLGLVESGVRATIRIDAYPDQVFKGVVTYVYPTLKPETRTVPVRIELANDGGLLKPGMFAQVELPTAATGDVLTVPASAVIDSGTRRIVLVQLQEGRFEPREIEAGARGDDRIEVVHGLREGEWVVVAANFLIDAESNLKAAIGGFGSAGQGVAKVGKPDGAAAAAVGHRAEGKIEEINATSGTVTIAHDAVDSLDWPPMSMEFVVANSALLSNLKPGAPVSFEFVERAPGEWVIISVNPTSGDAADPHAGH